jgi:hypothetical protein
VNRVLNCLFVIGAASALPRANDNTALIPEIWSREALATLMSNTIMASLVYRDFENQIADYGDVVNTSRPADFKGKRKTDADNVVTQNAVSPNIRVPLDQHLHVSFVIKDGEYSKALPDLLERYMEPAARELAEKVDQVLTGQAARLAVNSVGRLTEITELNADTFVLDADQLLNDNRAPKSGRYLVLSSKANRACLGAELFVSAEKRGDEGTALREASLGRVYGFDGFMDQNVNNVRPDLDDSQTSTITGAHPQGHASTIPTALTFASTPVGSYIRIPGHTRVYRVAVVTDNAGSATITLDQPLEKAVAAADPIVGTKAGAVNLVAGYANGYVKEIAVDGHASNRGPQVGQVVTFGTGVNSKTYTVIDVTVLSATSSEILLDRPLEAALVNDQAAFYGPAGNRNLAFTRDAIALVTRPLALPPEGSGARSAVTSFDGLSMRVVMTYDGVAQGTRVTFDLLCGVAILDERQAVVVQG